MMKPVDVDIDDVLRDVSQVLVERETGRSQAYRSEVREVGDMVYLMPGAWQNIANSLLSLDQSLAPLDGMFPAEEPTGVGRLPRAMKRLIKKVIRKSVYWYVNPVVAQLHSLHGAVARAAREIADQMKMIGDRVDLLEKENLDSRLRSLEGERFDERIGRLERAWRERPGEPAASAAGIEPAVRTARPVGRDLVGAGSVPALPGFHFDYYWFESIHRGDRALIKRRQQPYLEYFQGCRNVLDLGCGRGEFLELMAEKGIGGYGIDIEDDAIRYCVDTGLRAEQSEAIEHLASLQDESLDGVFVSQVVEHMSPREIIELVGLAFAKMRKGGYIVIETPNPQCLLIFASFFYADISHVQPIHPETIRFLLLSAGFSDVEIKLTNPVPRDQRLSRIVLEEGGDAAWVRQLNTNMEKLNSVLFSYMDYAAVARK